MASSQVEKESRVLDTKRRKPRPQKRFQPGTEQLDEKYFSKVVGRALNLLELIQRSSHPLSLGEITQQIGMAKSSVFRMLYTLEVAGYIRKDESGNYGLATEISPWVSRSFVKKLVDIAKPGMLAFRQKFNETVSLGMLFDNHIEVVALFESSQLIRMGNTVGRIIPPHASSMGKAITAFQTEKRREELLRSYGLHRFSERTITDGIELNSEFEEIRKNGWSVDNEESTEEGFCFGAPIRVGEEVRAAISISFPEARLPKNEAREKLLASLIKLTREISEELAGLQQTFLSRN